MCTLHYTIKTNDQVSKKEIINRLWRGGTVRHNITEEEGTFSTVQTSLLSTPSLIRSEHFAMAFGQQADMTDLSATTTQPAGTDLDLAHHLGQVSLDSSPVLTAKTPKFTRKFSLRELEIQQTIGKREFVDINLGTVAFQ